ncbi:MAG: PIN domain-containing protein [Gulosibacter sp.]|uniref:PIN domain-containing protein n=1 Tax=Gulosibacter sp. TaxID=2817531 RepID=UPI003F921AFE
MAFPAFLDTCTVFGGALNDLLLTLAERRTFRPLWSRGVLAELERNLVKRGLSHEAVRRRIDAMQAAFPDAEVHGYEALTEQMLCDDDDKHVLAVAVRSNAAVLVTFNLRHFPAPALHPYDIEVVHPDEFLLDQLDLHRAETLSAVRHLLDIYEHPPLTLQDLLEQLRRAGVPQVSHALQNLM